MTSQLHLTREQASPSYRTGMSLDKFQRYIRRYHSPKPLFHPPNRKPATTVSAESAHRIRTIRRTFNRRLPSANLSVHSVLPAACLTPIRLILAVCEIAT